MGLISVHSSYKNVNQFTGELGDVPLTALSRFTVAVKLHPQLYTYFICKSLIPHVYHYLDEVTTNEGLRQLSICLNHTSKLISSDGMEKFEAKVHQFVADGKLKDDTRTVMKLLQFFCLPHYSQSYLPLIRTLQFQLQYKIPTLPAKDLSIIAMV